MRVTCAWCGTSLTDKEPLDDLRTSHGICGKCTNDMLPNGESSMYDDRHKCEVSRNDLNDVRYDLERRTEELGRSISDLQDAVASLRQQLRELYETIGCLTRGD